ncbi:Ribonuclease H1 [Nowakowskiella sp. JEL0407]|nr:Ribonuclease H1 [Nowakowskiella sp. JEL0407]
MAKKKYYAVKGYYLSVASYPRLIACFEVGNRVGIYHSWTDCSAFLKGSPNEYRGFASIEDCVKYLKEPPVIQVDLWKGPFSEEKLKEWATLAENMKLPSLLNDDNSNDNNLKSKKVEAEPSKKRELHTFQEEDSVGNSTVQEEYQDVKKGKLDPADKGSDAVISSTPSISSKTQSVAIQSVNNLVEKKYIVYTDGCCFGNGQKRYDIRAGIGVFWGYNNPRNLSERLPGYPQTNNRAEIMAAIRAIETAPEDATILEINTDSKYVIDGITSWIHKRGWRTDYGINRNILNNDLWNRLDKIVHNGYWKDRIQWKYVAGHSGHPQNDAADRLAKVGANKMLVVEEEIPINPNENIHNQTQIPTPPGFIRAENSLKSHRNIPVSKYKYQLKQISRS